MKDTIMTWINDHAEILIASFIGGWIQIYYTKKNKKKKKIKFSFTDLIMNLVIAMFIGWGMAEVMGLIDKKEWATVIAMLASISSNSILNTYLNNEKGFWKQLLSLKFNIKLDDK